jgi:hypothetical protein
MLDQINDEKHSKEILPEDLDYMKKFVRDRLAYLRENTSLTATQVEALNDNKETQQFEIMDSALHARYTFKTSMLERKQKMKTLVEDLQQKKEPVPSEVDKYFKLLDASLKWFEDQKFVAPDIYEDKRKEVEEKAKELGAAAHLDFSSSKALMNSIITNNAVESESFDFKKLFSEVFGYVGTIVLVFVLLLGGVLGASLATNLNIYKPSLFRILYAIYGFLFFFIVIPYVIGYRYFWLGKKPKFYGLIPLVPYHFDNPIAAFFLSWMSYRPDDARNLKEWDL